MVAITVILAAVIGTFVLDLGQKAMNSPPQASLSVDTDTSGDTITIEHVGGDGLDAAQTRVVITNESSGQEITFPPASSTDVLAVGDTFEVDVTGPTTSGWSVGSSTDTFPSVQSGLSYTIQLTDMDSDQIVFETTVTA
jgi:FlaG/FlaF family flagellin (archaellin)